MRASAVACVRRLVDQYRRYLRTSYKFLDPALRRQFETHLAGVDVVVRGPLVTLSRDFVLGPTLTELVARGDAEPDLLRANWAFGASPLFAHQARALEIGRAGRSFVVTTGTGSGKTESFLLPVLDGIARRKRDGVRGVQALLLYPMNALANDQLERLRRLLRGTGMDVSIALYTGDSDVTSSKLREAPSESERLSRSSTRDNPPDILLTNYKQLELMLVRAVDRALFTDALRFLVLDEVHSYRGALATEIACLIRRLKAHSGVEKGRLLGIATSATVASGGDGPRDLAEFATVLYGETFLESDVIVEQVVPSVESPHPWTPKTPQLNRAQLEDLDSSDESQVVALAESLTGRRAPIGGGVADRVRAVLDGNRVVQAIESAFEKPAALSSAVDRLRAELPQRAGVDDESLRLEVESYLTVGSIGDDDSLPRVRPKLHTFFHGVYDVWLCTSPVCRTLVPQGGGRCTVCGSAALPAALCRTCGQDFLKVAFTDANDTSPIGTADFFSGELTGFLTPKLHELDADRGDGEEGSGEDDVESARPPEPGKTASDKLELVRLCTKCVRIADRGASTCASCSQPTVTYLLHRGAMHSCPACGDIYTRGDIVTPLRTGTASTVSALATHHLDLLEGEDRKLLVFADNRQDVAHQAGYTADRHRQLALRHVIADVVTKAGAAGVSLADVHQKVFDAFRALRIITGKLRKDVESRWLLALSIESAAEFTRNARQRSALERLGLVGVEYEFLDDVARRPEFADACVDAGIELDLGLRLVRAVLDTMRKNRAVGFEFFQEYIDPSRKSRYRELQEEPYEVRFPDRDRMPHGFALDRPSHIRAARSGSVLGFFQENEKAGQLTAVHKVVARVVGSRARAVEFLKNVVPILEKEKLLVAVPKFPIPPKERTPSLRVLQVSPDVVRLVAQTTGWRCSACQHWFAFDLSTCPTPRCKSGRLERVGVDPDNYYVRIYRDAAPKSLRVLEHTAQVPADQRADRETDFKDGRIDALVCSPTLELGVDIGPLLTVLLRNAPPTPANYVQRVGRAGRRLRIGFVSTFCAGGAHDRHAFESPLWLVAGQFRPPRVRLDNQKIVERHLRSFVLEQLDAQLPGMMGEFLDDTRTPSRWMPEKVEPLFVELSAKCSQIATRCAALFEADRALGRLSGFDADECARLVAGYRATLEEALEAWWQRVRQVVLEHDELANVGASQADERKRNARKRAFYELTADRERAYTLNYLSMRGMLPAYQFPLDAFSLEPGVQDTSTLYRPAQIALDEFAPGNFVYANGHKLKSIRVLFAGGASAAPLASSSTAQATGRLHSFVFCENCDEAFEAGRNTCSRCGAPAGSPKSCVFVDAFEAEESLRIGSDEESRQRERFRRRENLLVSPGGSATLYPYELAPIEVRPRAEMLVTNWGPAPKGGAPREFWLCPECGRHRPGDPSAVADKKKIDDWDKNRHGRFCKGVPELLVLAYRFSTDCLVLSVPSPEDEDTRAGQTVSPTLTTLAEALALGASEVLEIESGEVASFPRRLRPGSRVAEIVFYETSPGGAGYAEALAARLPQIAEAARRRLFGHECTDACYLCLKRFHNQHWHPFLRKDAVRDYLAMLAALSGVKPVSGAIGRAHDQLAKELPNLSTEVLRQRRAPGLPGPQSPIEERLLEALRAIEGLPEPVAQYEVRDGARVVTVPDFAYPDERIAVFCDGFAFHGNRDTLELDASKRNWLQREAGGGWVVLTFWGRTINANAKRCAEEVAAVWRERNRRLTRRD